MKEKDLIIYNSIFLHTKKGRHKAGLKNPPLSLGEGEEALMAVTL